MKEKIIIEMTPFIFEDGNTYYFKIVKREYSNDYHDLYVFEKIVTKTKNFWGKEKVNESYERLNESPELISIKLDTNYIKTHIQKVLTATKADYKLKNWDGFVGNIPDEIKISIKRDARLKDILGE